jgi:hypothetical protein
MLHRTVEPKFLPRETLGDDQVKAHPVREARPTFSRWLYGRRSVLPEDVTSRDLLKAVALILMVLDHIGLYFVDLELLRAVGRCSMPIWLFLIGYSDSSRLPPVLWLGGLAMLAVDLSLGFTVWPMRILFTIIVARLILTAIGDMVFRSPVRLCAAVAVMLVALSPSREILQYGTHAFLFAIMGYGRLNMKRLDIGSKPLVALMIVTLVSYFMLQTDRFGFDVISVVVFAGLLLATGSAMFSFRPLAIPGTHEMFGASFVKLMGRRTLEIYVIHLAAFKTAFWAWNHDYLSALFT